MLSYVLSALDSSGPSSSGSSTNKGGLVRFLSPEKPPLEASLTRQLKLVEVFLQQDKVLGSTLGEGKYLVSAKWWNTWVETCHASASFSPGAQTRYAMAPVDNSDLLLVDPSTKELPRLRTGLRVGALHPDVHSTSSESFVYVPRTVWENCFERWYVQRTNFIGGAVNLRYQGLASRTTHCFNRRRPALHSPSSTPTPWKSLAGQLAISAPQRYRLGKREAGPKSLSSSEKDRGKAESAFTSFQKLGGRRGNCGITTTL